jgi:hypothetical protein
MEKITNKPTKTRAKIKSALAILFLHLNNNSPFPAIPGPSHHGIQISHQNRKRNGKFGN